ncbi:large conductance mechanosensitive channel protein MscL [Niallia sp. 03133]|uniref:large conductance mechanosensitive channel protein MscL n=1 Tax=Niallia sp. 03133 TaxID=3458060 RepID=UPI004043AE43
MWKEFKQFAMKGNVVDLAVGVIIGSAFGKIVSSLVKDVITPLIGILIGGLDFSNLSFTYKKAHIMYGQFIQSIFDFFIIAFSIFMVIKVISSFKKKEEVKKEEEKKADAKEELLMEIRDLLKGETVREK